MHRSGGNTSLDTFDIINEMCNECETPLRDCCHQESSSSTRDCYPRPSHSSQQNCSSSQRYDPGVASFTSVITPVSGLTPQYSGCTGSVEFRMRRKNKTVTLQWEPFTGSLAASGIGYLTVAQTICNTPPYPVSFPIYLQYKGVGRMTHISIDPFSTTGNVKFYLNTDGSVTDTNIGDSFAVPGGAITWVVD